MSNSLDPDQAQHFVKPDLGPNCLQKLSADNNSRQSFFAWFVVLRPSQQLWSCRDGQLNITTFFPVQA